jgi:hypothetical protein
MIVDPNAGVYAATGLLPRKRISIPSSMYAAALRDLIVTFGVAPLLGARSSQPGGPDRVGIPVPAEPGFDWTWLTRADGALDTASVVPPTALGGAFELADGWLALAPTKGRN